MLLSARYPKVRIVLSSPLLCLGTQRRRAGKALANWFLKRFSSKDFYDISVENFPMIEAPVTVIYSRDDEVLGQRPVSLLAKATRPNNKWKWQPQPGGHSPKTYKEFSARFTAVLKALTWVHCRRRLVIATAQVFADGGDLKPGEAASIFRLRVTYF